MNYSTLFESHEISNIRIPLMYWYIYLYLLYSYTVIDSVVTLIVELVPRLMRAFRDFRKKKFG